MNWEVVPDDEADATWTAEQRQIERDLLRAHEEILGAAHVNEFPIAAIETHQLPAVQRLQEVTREAMQSVQDFQRAYDVAEEYQADYHGALQAGWAFDPNGRTWRQTAQYLPGMAQDVANRRVLWRLILLVWRCYASRMWYRIKRQVNHYLHLSKDPS